MTPWRTSTAQRIHVHGVTLIFVISVSINFLYIFFQYAFCQLIELQLKNMLKGFTQTLTPWHPDTSNWGWTDFISNWSVHSVISSNSVCGVRVSGCQGPRKTLQHFFNCSPNWSVRSVICSNSFFTTIYMRYNMYIQFIETDKSD